MRPLAFEYDLSQHVDEAEPAMLFGGSTVEELRDWQERFRAKVLSLLGILPERAALVIEFESETDCGTYIRHKIRYQTERDVWVPAYLLVPKGVSAYAEVSGDPLPARARAVRQRQRRRH